MICTPRRQRTRLRWRAATRRRRGRPTSSTAPPRRRRPAAPRRRWLLPAILVPVVLLVVLVIAWAVDTSSSEVARNVQLAGVDIGGLTEDELAGRVGDVAADFAATPVELQAGDVTYTATAGEIGLAGRRGRDHRERPGGRRGLLPARPPVRVGAVVRLRRARRPWRSQVERRAGGHAPSSPSRATPAPRRPSRPWSSSTARSTSSPASTAWGSIPPRWPSRLPAAAEAAVADDADVIQLDVDRGPIPPLGSEEEARPAAADAEALVSEPVEVADARAGPARSPPTQLRTWVRLASNPDGTVVVTFDDDAVASRPAAGLRRRRGPPRRRQLHPRGRRAR